MMPDGERISTGIAGLDDVLAGGLLKEHVYLIEGAPGTGKTTLALKFLLEGSRLGERCLYITMSENEMELRAGAASHGWTLDDNVTVFELIPPEAELDATQQQSLLYSADLELGETSRTIVEVFNRVKPLRVVIDSLSEIRLLAQGSLRYRRQILALKHFFASRSATVLLLDDRTSEISDKTTHSIVHGVVQLEELAPAYGAERRRMRVLKYRGTPFRGGYHDYSITTGGLAIFPRLRALEHRASVRRDQLTSGIKELDALLGGGIDRGSSMLILGPSGTGKTLFAIQFLCSAIARGEKAAAFIFDEELGLLSERMRLIGYDLDKMRERGNLRIEQVDAAELSPGEFAHRVRTVVDEAGASAVLIDSLNGYQAAMPDEVALILHIHELLQYLNRRGANTFLTVAQHGLVGDMRAPVDVTYLSDTLVLLRYFEAISQVRRAISVIKKRSGSHEDSIREYRIDNTGLRIGQPLFGFQGVLRGVPAFVGQATGLMEQGDGSASDS